MELIPTLFHCFIISLSLLASPIQSTSSGFSINLIHRDSQLSPYYNASSNYYDNLRNSLRRSFTRSSRIFAQKSVSSPLAIQSPLTAVPGEYLMKISVGTPPQDFLAVADTGSDITWIQCKPCIECYAQNTPIFDPKRSSTYKNQPCEIKICQRFEGPLLCGDQNFCTYEISYADWSYSKGDFSFDSFTFGTTSGKPVVLPKVSFGCGHRNGGNFNKFTDGIVGLGNSDLSIINQLSDTINGKFSYCMVPLKLNGSSKISFGSDAVVSGPGARTIPFYTSDDEDKALFYYLNLEGVSIGDTLIKFATNKYPTNANDYYGNIVIDSGTTLTLLPSAFYQKIEDEFKRLISSTPVEGEQDFSLCYKKEEGFEQKVPTITLHFTGGDWELDVSNTMLEMEDGKLCLTMAPSNLAVFGNLQQMNYLVGYDLVGKTLSFKKTDCSTQ
ncbi:aspartic proteinase CDR1-like [Heracleum sosnowskyi]|uniref:Aspartic proteinase CDR1-like n=1 Tax=Heracleum sosnowskyi TaxID=360622 RepID=A0AAD8HWT9_9APIA|nr:aspartic proteinase CDR1-like [Heracleum sosnowskyi]